MNKYKCLLLQRKWGIVFCASMKLSVKLTMCDSVWYCQSLHAVIRNFSNVCNLAVSTYPTETITHFTLTPTKTWIHWCRNTSKISVLWEINKSYINLSRSVFLFTFSSLFNFSSMCGFNGSQSRWHRWPTLYNTD